MKPNKKPIALAFAVACTTLGVAAVTDAQLLFEDDFESYEVGEKPGEWNDIHATLVADAGSPFGGEGNKYAHTDDPKAFQTGQLHKVLNELDDKLTTFAFNMVEPSSEIHEDPAFVGYGYDDLSSAHRIGTITLDDGRIGFASTGGAVTRGKPEAMTTYALDTPYRFFMVMNDTEEPATYEAGGFGEQTVGAGAFDVYFLDPATGDLRFVGGHALGENRSKGLMKLGFRTMGQQAQQLMVDNVLVSEGAVGITGKPGTEPIPAPEVEGETDEADVQPDMTDSEPN